MITQRILVVLALVVLCVQAAWCSPLIFSRPLPTSGVNAPEDRSNWGVAVTFPYYVGDDFVAPNTSPAGWSIDSIAIYSLASAGSDNLFTDFGEISLLVGADLDPAGYYLKMQGTATTILPNLNSNPNIYSERVYYPGLLDYVGWYTETTYSVWKTTFNNLDWFVPNGDLGDPNYLYFAVNGVSKGDLPWFNLGTTAARAGNLQMGADDLYLKFSSDNFGPPPIGPWLLYATDTDGGSFPADFDMNVEVYGVAADPEPGTVFLVALGGIFLIACRAKRRLV